MVGMCVCEGERERERERERDNNTKYDTSTSHLGVRGSLLKNSVHQSKIRDIPTFILCKQHMPYAIYYQL